MRDVYATEDPIDAERLTTKRDRAPWPCPKCGETIEGQFTACWHCGTERPS